MSLKSWSPRGLFGVFDKRRVMEEKTGMNNRIGHDRILIRCFGVCAPVDSLSCCLNSIKTSFHKRELVKMLQGACHLHI